jgi:long-chain fatty acid transport protein
MTRDWYVCLALGGALLVGATPGRAVAQGYSVNEHSACATGRAGTGVASPCADGSAMVYNPAGLADLGKGRTVISAGGTLIAPSGGFTNDATGLTSDLDNKIYPVPTLYAAHGFTDRLAVGIGLFAPYGLTTDWPTTSEARFQGYHSLIRNIYIQPTVAFKVHKMISLGAGLDFNFGHVELQQHLDLAPIDLPDPAPPGLTFANLGIQPGTDFADAQLSGNGTSVGGHFGVIIQPKPWLSFGVRYLTKQTVNYNDGTVAFTQINTGIILPQGNPLQLPAGTPLDLVLSQEFAAGAPLSNGAASTTLTNPDQWIFGVAVDPTPKLKLLFDVTLSNWSLFQEVKFDFANATTPDLTLVQDNVDVTTYRLGAQYAVSPTVDLRAGYINHGAASPDNNVTANLPEGPRSELTAGIGVGVGSGFRIDGAYQYIDQADRRGRTLPPEAFPPGASQTNGLYKFHAHLFSASISYVF